MLEAIDVSKEYPTPRGALAVLTSVSLTLSPGDAVSIIGPSGSGKSTLLHILGALDPPTSGTVTLDETDPYRLGDKELAAFRNKKIGFVFQDHCLLPQCSVLENVLTPTLVGASNHHGGSVDRARALLDQVGLSDRVDHRPAQLSGGEKQRVAVARALINEPVLLLCDEPTGNLDHRAADVIAAMLLDLHHRAGSILVVVTHSGELAARFPIRFEMADGNLRRL
ncbi:MAG TPA: ABC transporter ATP-binding protein [Blastocatellia bacterium]|nr:ABC transporter ATP-binding protein [Blastocatellia bacterium]